MNKKITVQVMEESKKENVKSEQNLNSEQQPIDIPSSPDSANTDVVCSQTQIAKLSTVTLKDIECLLDKINPHLKSINEVIENSNIPMVGRYLRGCLCTMDGKFEPCIDHTHLS